MGNTSTVTVTATLPANGRLRIQDGNIFALISSGAAVDVTFTRGGTNFGSTGITTGYEKGVLIGNAWEMAYITGTPGAQVKYAVGYDEIEEEYTRFSTSLSLVTQVLPQTVADQADVDVGTSAVAVIVAPVNAARRRVTVKLREDAATNVRVGSSAVTATRGLQLTPGQSKDFEGPYAVYAIREAALAAFTTMVEEVN